MLVGLLFQDPAPRVSREGHQLEGVATQVTHCKLSYHVISTPGNNAKGGGYFSSSSQQEVAGEVLLTGLPPVSIQEL
jgi:hypothetical protein